MLKKSDKILYNFISEKNLVPKKILDSVRAEAEAKGEDLQRLLVSKGLFSEKGVGGKTEG